MPNLLNKNEIEYLNNLINDKSQWVYRTYYNDIKQYFDSIVLDESKLKSFYNLLTENGKYEIEETGLIVITPERQLEDSTHMDGATNFSYVTYVNTNFSGGNFYYIETKGGPFIEIVPESNLTLKIDKHTKHKVNAVTDGVRFSINTFVGLVHKKNKSLL
jgi:hypothetical protein